MRTQTFHRGTSNTHICAYKRRIKNGARFKLILGGAGKGTGDTKTKWYYLVSTQPCTKEHKTYPCALPATLKLLLVPKLTEKIEAQGVLGRALVIPKRSGTTWRALILGS